MEISAPPAGDLTGQPCKRWLGGIRAFCISLQRGVFSVESLIFSSHFSTKVTRQVSVSLRFGGCLCFLANLHLILHS